MFCGFTCKKQILLQEIAVAPPPPPSPFSTVLYGDILYDQAYNMSLHQKLESIQYNAC